VEAALGTALGERQRALAAAGPVVMIDGVSKTFRIPHQQYHTLKERVLHPFRARTFDVLRAVDDVTLTVPQGEFFGIVGRNGSGKSTLLKCLAGIYRPDGGQIEVDGRLSPFIELGVGFNPELAARDNVLINAVMLGLSRNEAMQRFDEIIAFAELEEFVDLALKNYSSGMAVRLGFAVATQVDADILLVDEVLAVGDASFQQKCFEAFQRLKDAGKTILLVTHDMGLVERFCDRAMLLERGEVLMIGDPHAVALGYNEVNFGRLVPEGAPERLDRSTNAAEIVACWFESSGEQITDVAQGESLEVIWEVRFHTDVVDPVFALSLRSDIGQTVFTTSTAWHERRSGYFRTGELVRVRAAFEAWLAPGRYRATPSVARAGSGASVLDLREDLASVILHATRVTGGVIDPPHSLDVERVEEASA
jgi:ABC-type polysaccharide/polyol phosphate transport system ATPase subunit